MPIMGFPIGYQGAFPIDVEVPGAPSDFDPDAMAWFEAVEAEGANFGPTPEIAAANKTAWSNWVIAQKNAESPISGKSNWDQLTQAGEGFIQPLMGVSTFNIPTMFGGSTFTGFVSGDYLPALGLKGGSGKSLVANRSFAAAPLTDISAGMWLTEAGSIGSNNRIFGGAGRTLVLADARGTAHSGLIPVTGSGPVYTTGTFPRAAFVSRSSSNKSLYFNDVAYTITESAVLSQDEPVTFFARAGGSQFTNNRAGLAFYGRSIDLEAMNTACIALSEAITW